MGNSRRLEAGRKLLSCVTRTPQYIIRQFVHFQQIKSTVSQQWNFRMGVLRCVCVVERRIPAVREDVDNHRTYSSIRSCNYRFCSGRLLSLHRDSYHRDREQREWMRHLCTTTLDVQLLNGKHWESHSYSQSQEDRRAISLLPFLFSLAQGTMGKRPHNISTLTCITMLCPK